MLDLLRRAQRERLGQELFSWLKLTQRRPVLDERAGMHHLLLYSGMRRESAWVKNYSFRGLCKKYDINTGNLNKRKRKLPSFRLRNARSDSPSAARAPGGATRAGYTYMHTSLYMLI